MPENFNILEILMNFLFDSVVPYLWRIIGALLVLAIGFKIINLVVKKVTKTKGYEAPR